MDPKYSSGRTKASVCKYSTEKRGSHNKFCKYAKEYMYIRRGSKLIRKACDRTCSKDQEGQGYYSTFSSFPKKDGGFHPILNLRELNKYLKVPHFKMETLKTNHLCIRTKRLGSFHGFKGCVPSRRSVSSTQKVSTILHYGNHYQFRAMPFGLAVAPRIFTKLMAVIGSYLRAREIQIYMYLDDWLIKNQNREILVSQSRDGVTVDRAPRSHSKSCQVSFGAQSGDSVPRGRVQSPGGNDLSYIGEMYKNTGGNQVANVSDTSDSTVVSPCFRIDGVLHRPYTTGTITYAPYPVLYPVILAPTQGQLVSCYPSAGYVDSTPQMVAGLQQYYGRDLFVNPIL